MDDTITKPRPAPGTCPDRQVLSDLALGKLPLGTIESIGRHIESCPACQDALESLDGLEDSLVADLKGQSPPLPPSPQLQAQIQAAEEISRVVWGESRPDVPDKRSA